MKLIVFGKELDASVEHEIVSDTEFGMKATIILNDEAPKGWVNEVRRNLTEVHYWYDQARAYGEDQSAFESDIHSCGGTLRNKYIKEIIVEHDTALADDVYERNRYDETSDSDPIWDTV